MQVIEYPKKMQELSEQLRREGKILGLVPTMGALHEGHLSLLRRCRAENDLSVMSLFVNPAQFDRKDDLAAYPQDWEGDFKKAEAVGVDLVYAPTAGMMYPEGYQTYVEVEALTRRWEGASRPGHFRGVATVVAKLFTIVKPHQAYFGQKDYQQALVVQRMVQDLNLDLEVIILPIIREEDGLASSSRNWNLSPEERCAAPVLYKALQAAEARVRAGEQGAEAILERMREIIEAEPLAEIDYIACCHPMRLEPVERITESVVFLLAVWIGRTRLIDNALVEVPAQA
ncbi:MAG: pantoate--beta-alanine ligase [candidate division NC10 bacterium]|nr:pantoate--beta-alanine ligase [candidate division NC10 bacterium]